MGGHAEERRRTPASLKTRKMASMMVVGGPRWISPDACARGLVVSGIFGAEQTQIKGREGGTHRLPRDVLERRRRAADLVVEHGALEHAFDARRVRHLLLRRLFGLERGDRVVSPEGGAHVGVDCGWAREAV